MKPGANVPVSFVGSAAVAANPPFKILYSFCAQNQCADGSEPTGLVADQSGNLYGTTVSGGVGNMGLGTAFELRRELNGAYSYHLLHSFCRRRIHLLEVS